MKDLTAGTRIAFSYQQFAKASWFGTATVCSYDPKSKMYTVDRDEEAIGPRLSSEVCSSRERWPEHHVRKAAFQPGEPAPEEETALPVVRPSEVRVLTQLGYRLNVHFRVPALQQG